MNRALIAILAVLAVVLVVMVMLLRSGGGEPLERPSEDEEQVATESGTSRDLREWQPEVPPSSATPDRSASVPARRVPKGDEDEREEAGRASPVRGNDGEEGDYFDDIRRRYTPEPSREQDEDVRYQSFLEDWMRRQRRLSGDFDRISRRVRAGETELAQRYNDTVDALVNELTETLGAEFAKNFMMRLKTDHIDADTGARLPRPQ